MKRSIGVLIFCLVLVSFAGLVDAAHEGYFILIGDLHCHSDFSHDSEVPIEQVVAESVIAGYDFISITDHNTVRHMTQDYSTDDILVMSGYEHTTPAAHVNIFGLRYLPRKSAIYTLEAMEEYLQPLREQGAYIQLDHPNDNLYYSRFGYDMEMDFLEVWNGVWREDDHKTLNDWHDMIVAGRYIPATGGSDAHGNHARRNVFNHVYVQEKSEGAILEALAAGRNFVTRYVDSPVISMECGGEIMGGTAIYRDGQTMTININNVRPGLTLKVYSNHGLHFEDVHKLGGAYKITLDTVAADFFRVELWANDTTIEAFSNPIFIKH